MDGRNSERTSIASIEDSGSDSFLHHRLAPVQVLHGGPTRPTASERARPTTKTTMSTTRSTTLDPPSDQPYHQGKKRRLSQSPEIEHRFTLAGLRQLCANRTHGGPKPPTPKSLHPRSPQQAALSDLQRTTTKVKERHEEADDLAFSDFDDDYMDHQQRDKQSKRIALGAYSPALPGDYASMFRSEALRKKRYGQARRTSQAPLATQPGDVTHPIPVSHVHDDLNHRQAYRTAALKDSSAARAPLTSWDGSRVHGQTEPSRPWALPAKFVTVRPQDPPPDKLFQSKTSVTTQASRARCSEESATAGPSVSTVVDLDSQDESDSGRVREDDAEEGEDDSDGEVFGMDALSPKSRRAFYAIAGLDEEGRAPVSNLPEEWNFMVQEKVVKASAIRGKTWKSHRGRAKPWFRGRKRGGAGRGKRRS